jgi:hypothetical protein
LIPLVDENGMTTFESWHPAKIETTITVSINSAQLDVDIAFGRAEAVKLDMPEDSDTDSLIKHNVEDLLATWRYFPLEHEMTEPINNHAITGATIVDGVPPIEKAIYLGNSFDDVRGEWSTWLHVSPCIAQTVEVETAKGKKKKRNNKHPERTDGLRRIFSFHYTVFSFCDCPRHDKDCSCEKDSFVVGDTKEVMFSL